MIDLCNEKSEIIREGLAKICVPRRDLYLRKNGVYEPSWAPVFYNPVMAMNRDMTILAINILSESSRIKSASDLMAATGVRGIRIALECPSIEEVYLNDIDPVSCRYIEKNIMINSVRNKIRLFCEDFGSLARSLVKSGVKIDFNDVDPYGSPALYVSPAIDLTRRDGFISFTATDIGSLSGTYPHKSLKRYEAHVIKTDFSREVGLRVLIGYIARRASEKNYGIKPIIAYYSDHYYKVITRISRGSEKALETLKKTGFYRYCRSCGYRDHIYFEDLIDLRIDRNCPVCGSKLSLIGPLWLGDLWDKEFIEKAIDYAEKKIPLENRDKAMRILSRIKRESSIETPYYYTTDHIASRVKTFSPPLNKLMECVRSRGYYIERTHFDDKGLRTNAPFRDLIECIKETSGENRSS